MAPEQARGDRDVDARADVFALGGVLFRCLSGTYAFDGHAPAEVLCRLVSDEVAPRLRALRPAIPRELFIIYPGDMKRLAILMLASPVGPIGSGEGGGEEMILRLAAAELTRRGHRVSVVAPRGSVVPAAAVVLVDGVPQRGAQRDSRAAAISMPADPVIANMCSRARDLAGSHDVLLNFAYDWLPFYLTAFFSCPVAHWVQMASLTHAMDHVIGDIATRFPGTVASCTRAQAETFPFADKLHLLGAGLDLSKYEFCAKPDAYLAWMGRISPEKGLEDAAAAARLAGLPLKVMGLVQDPEYLASMRSAYPEVIEHVGFLAMPALQEVLRRASALLVTPHWVEALGMVLLEALACGVPVVAYRRGGPADIVRHGETGWLVTPDSVADLARAVGRLGAIDRRACRAQVEREHDIHVVGERVERWLSEVAGK